MKKSDLKNMMVVELRNGNRYLVVDDFLIGEDDSLSLHNYCSEDLMSWEICSDKPNGLDIMKVYDSKIRTFNGVKDQFDPNCIWKRPEVKEVTMADLEKYFGCKVRVFKEKDHCCTTCNYKNLPPWDDRCADCIGSHYMKDGLIDKWESND